VGSGRLTRRQLNNLKTAEPENRPDARPDPGRPGRLPTHLTDPTVEQVTLFCLREDGFAQELRVLLVSRSAPGLPTVITPEVRTIGGIAGTRRRAGRRGSR